MQKIGHLKSCKDIFDSFYNGIIIINESGIIIIYNKAAGRILRTNPDKMLGKFIGEIAPSTWADIELILRTGEPQIGKKITLEGFTIIANRNPIFQDKRIIGVISVFQDASEYEKVLTELESYKRLNEELDAIINSSFDGLWICDHEGRVVRINPASEKISDIKADQVIGKKMEDLIREGLVDRSSALEVLKNRTAVTMIQRLKNGKKILVTGNPVFNHRGEIRLVVVNERDITGLDSLRNELEESRALSRQYRSEISYIQNYKNFVSQAVIRSESMQRVLDTAVKVAKVDSTVLIQGETGVGKGLFAKFIHQASDRREGPFIRVDCGAIPESLIESELFGYEGGAFTGARAKGKPGQFELAEGGTLFLDEVGELPSSVQIRLLRFLDETALVRVGGTTLKKINTRIIAATHRNLEDMSNQGTLRKDLFFRLSVVPLRIPPLKERLEDIAPLVHFFLKRFSQKCGTEKVILPQAVDCLCNYPFPGNIRELANLVERLVVLTPGDHIELEDLPAHVRIKESLIDHCFEGDEWNLPKAVKRLEREIIIRALKTFGSQRKAAVHLGIDQSTLARKAKRCGIRSDAIVHFDE